MWQLQITIVDAWTHVEYFLQPFLKNLDPSLFQNIILGILAIFIPFAIVFLTDVLGSKKQRSEFEKMVLSEEVFGTKSIFWLAVIGILFLAFFTGKDISPLRKVIAIIFSGCLVSLFWKSFKRILRFSEGYKPEFEIRFLKSLKPAKIFRFKNRAKMERMVRAWSSFWSEKSEYNEREFTKVFISHIDGAVDSKNFALAVQVSQPYLKNLEKRDAFSIGYEILPKVFEWHEKFWEAQQEWLNRRNREERVQKFFSQKNFPTFKKWTLGLFKKIYAKDDSFWNWHYFQQEFFPAIAKALLAGGHEPYQLFTCFKKYIDEAEAKLDGIEDEGRKQRWWNYIMALFGSFCPMFFENINGASGSFDIWEHYYPADWKIVSANSKKRTPRIILHEFEEWARQRIFKKNDTDYDEKLTEVINGIFPNVHPDLFSSFLALLFSGDIKSAIQRDISFSIIGTGMTFWGEKSDAEIGEMFRQQELSQKQETAGIIFAFFSEWSKLKIYKDDLSAEEGAGWKEYSEEKRKEIIARVRRSKLQKMLEELNSAEIKEECKDSEPLELRRISFINLIQLLLEQVPS